MKAEEQRMAGRYQKILGPGGPGKEKKAAERQAGAGNDDTCRCKEVSEMKPRQLFGLMISDLAFWKRTKKG
jgi:hypothetical protein